MQDRHIELLTAFIDGELTRRERIDVLRLLNQSSEARTMLWQIQQNSLIVKQLPAKTLPADFSTKIVEIIVKTAAAAAPAQQPAAAAAARFGPRVAIRLAWAAGLLLAVAGGAWYFFRDAHNPNDPPQIVKNDEQRKLPDPPIVHNQEPKEKKIEPPPKIDPKIEIPKETPRPFDGRFVFADLMQRPKLDLLEKELSRATSIRSDLFAVRVELFVANNRQALEQIGRKLKFQTALNLKKPKDKEFIFVENLAPADVAGFLRELANEDKGTKRIFNHMRVQPMSEDDQKYVCAELNIKPNELHFPMERVKLPNIIEGKDKDKKDLVSPGPMQPPVPERRAVVLTREDAKTIRNFVDQRRRLKPDTVQVLFVVNTSA